MYQASINCSKKPYSELYKTIVQEKKKTLKSQSSKWCISWLRHDPHTRINLNHSAEQFVKFLLTITEITAFNVVGRLLAPASGRGVQLNWRNNSNFWIEEIIQMLTCPTAFHLPNLKSNYEAKDLLCIIYSSTGSWGKWQLYSNFRRIRRQFKKMEKRQLPWRATRNSRHIWSFRQQWIFRGPNPPYRWR